LGIGQVVCRYKELDHMTLKLFIIVQFRFLRPALSSFQLHKGLIGGNPSSLDRVSFRPSDGHGGNGGEARRLPAGSLMRKIR
jgi:hypothetical protein